MRISKSKLMNGIRFVVHNYYRAGFLSMTVGAACIFYGILLLFRNNGWVGYFEIVVGGAIILLGYFMYRSYWELLYWRKRLDEIHQQLDEQQKRINWF